MGLADEGGSCCACRLINVRGGVYSFFVLGFFGKIDVRSKGVDPLDGFFRLVDRGRDSRTVLFSLDVLLIFSLCEA